MHIFIILRLEKDIHVERERKSPCLTLENQQITEIKYINLPWVKIDSSDWWQKEKEHLLNCNTNGNSGLPYNSNLKSSEGYFLGIKRL